MQHGTIQMLIERAWTRLVSKMSGPGPGFNVVVKGPDSPLLELDFQRSPAYRSGVGTVCPLPPPSPESKPSQAQPSSEGSYMSMSMYLTVLHHTPPFLQLYSRAGRL